MESNVLIAEKSKKRGIVSKRETALNCKCCKLIKDDDELAQVGNNELAQVSRNDDALYLMVKIWLTFLMFRNLKKKIHKNSKKTGLLKMRKLGSGKQNSRLTQKSP